jgi:hypothetical protein
MLGKALLSASVSAAPAVYYVEDVFSTYLYTGNGSTQTITNGIDLSTNGGLVWIKRRNLGGSHNFIDTVRGQNKILFSDFDFGEFTSTPGTGLTSFTSSGFELGPSYVNFTNTSGSSLVSWTFRKAEKFFDVVTYTGNSATQNIAHNLGSDPGCIIVKRTDTDGDWWVYHRSLGNTGYARLNFTQAAGTSSILWNSTTPTSTQFTLGASAVNISGGTYVAYLFAHDAGGFGDAGTDNVISCGGYTGNGADDGPTISLGWEPQWLLIKRSAGGTGEWILVDTMRGMTADGSVAFLEPNTSDAEANNNYVRPTADGFKLTATGSVVNASGSTYIYIAIRRGPMRAPTDGTEVFAVDTDGFTLNNGVAFTSGWPVDYALLKEGSNSTDGWYAMSRLQGNGNYLQTNNINVEASGIAYGTFDHNTGWFSTPNASYSWMFRRAPGFFDVVAYTGTGSARTVAHNLGVAPEMMIVKSRSDERAWRVYTSFVGNTGSLRLNSDATADSGNTGYWNNTTPTDASFTLGIDNDTNSSGQTYIAYLFATLAGISKVGSYTGTGTTLNIDCGFTAGARFVLIKRTDSTGDWYVWDTARGISAGNDPYLLLNSVAAEVTNTDYIDPLSSGFQISSTAPAAINASGGSFIFLAIA